MIYWCMYINFGSFFGCMHLNDLNETAYGLDLFN